MPPMDYGRLAPGDVLLYGGIGWVNRLIQLKTWSRYSHVEIYDGHGWSLASRNGIGVGRFPLRTEGLLTVLRLRVAFDMDALRDWHETVDGQPYDWWGLLAFTSAKRQGRENWKMFCSEYAARGLRVAIGAAHRVEYPAVARGNRRALAMLGLDPWNGYDADGISPSEFPKSALLREEQTV